MRRLTVEMRTLARLAVVLLVAVGVVLMHGVSVDHDVMRTGPASGHVMAHETTAPDTHGAPVAGTGDAMMTMGHAACVAVLRAPDGAPHVPVAPTAVVAGDAGISTLTTSVGDTHLPSRAPPPDLATELCIDRT